MVESKSAGKSFEIDKFRFMRAWEKVKANGGAAGVDGVMLEKFEENLKDNLYKIWNRMSSGTYFPPPVRAVEIPKAGGGGVRTLGIPTVADRIAQTVVAMTVEPAAEKVFHPDSYGYRPGRFALDAVDTCRERCWKMDWVVDLDIKAFFDTVPHDRIYQAVAAHTDQKWVLLYVRRWLVAPLQQSDGTLVARDRGTPQGPRSHHCCRTFSCTTRLICGCRGSSRRCGSNATATTPWCTAGTKLKHARFGLRSRTG
jgi:RNA-directed DNA polymerase